MPEEELKTGTLLQIKENRAVLNTMMTRDIE